MSQPKYPLIKSLGLEVFPRVIHGGNRNERTETVEADALEAKLQAGVRATRYEQYRGVVAYWSTPDIKGSLPEQATHTGLIIDIKPIAKECAHVPYIKYSGGGEGVYPQFAKCEACGVILQASWAVKGDV